jgi:hypothetical protein
MKYTGEPVALRFHVVESDLIGNHRGRPDRADHTFQHVTGFELDQQLYGEPGPDAVDVVVPDDWALRLAEYHDRFMMSADGVLRPAQNCHAFARFMSGDSYPTSDAPKHVVSETTLVYEPGVELSFGQMAVLGRHDNGFNPDPLIGDVPQLRPPAALHSAIALGDAAPDLAIQVTTTHGYLALDRYDLVCGDYSHIPGPDFSWYAAPKVTPDQCL